MSVLWIIFNCYVHAKFLSPEQYTLENGLKIAVFKSDRLPLVDLVLALPIGTKKDPSGKSGMVKLMTNLLGRGSAGKSSLEMSTRVDNLAARSYFSADEESVLIGMHGMVSDMDALLQLIKDFALEPSFLPDEVKQEKQKIFDQWERLGDYAQGYAQLGFERIIYDGTPYWRGSALGKKELGQITSKDLKEFHQKNVIPNGAVLVIGGNVGGLDIQSRVSKFFGSWQGRAPSSPSQPKLPAIAGSRKSSKVLGEIVLIPRQGLNQAHIKVGVKVEKFEPAVTYPLLVINTVLGGTFNSRLNRILREEKSLVYSIGSQVQYLSDFGIWTVETATKNESIGDAILAIEKTLKQLHSEKISASELESAKDYLIGQFSLSTATVGSIASRWLSGMLLGVGSDYLLNHVDRLKSVNLESVNRELNKQRGPWTVVVSGDENLLTRAFQKSKISFKLKAPSRLFDS